MTIGQEQCVICFVIIVQAYVHKPTHHTPVYFAENTMAVIQYIHKWFKSNVFAFHTKAVHLLICKTDKKLSEQIWHLKLGNSNGTYL